MFRSPDLVTFALSQPLFLLLAWLLGTVTGGVVRRRALVTGATMTIVSVLGICLGMLIAALLLPAVHPWSPVVLVISFATDVVVLLVASTVILARRVEAPAPQISDQIADGESDRLEFKSSARWNLRTAQKDDRMEQVVAKSIAAFLNSAGGTLLIGVDDEGRMLGLANDFSTLKAPDCDRFELWLRDLLHTRLDATAAALPSVDFLEITDEHVSSGRADADASGAHVCRVQVPASTEPVYLRGKSGPELWVRVGNSSRGLAIDDAVRYVRRRWPTAIGATARARVALRFGAPRLAVDAGRSEAPDQ